MHKTRKMWRIKRKGNQGDSWNGGGSVNRGELGNNFHNMVKKIECRWDVGVVIVRG